MRSRLKLIPKVMQRVFGLILLLFGLNKLFGIIAPPTGNLEAQAFLHALESVGYLMPTVILIQVITGLSLLFNRYTRITLLAMLPVSFNILGFHLFLDLPGIAPALYIFGVNSVLLILKMKDLKWEVLCEASA